MGTALEILRMLREYQFDSVIPLVTQTLRDAAAESPQRLTEVARDLVRWQGIFKNNTQAMTAEPYFRAVHTLLEELAGPESPAAMAAAENLAGLLGSIGKVDEAILLRERVLAHLSRRFPSDDQRVLIVKDGLGILYRRAGREDKSEQLYDRTGLCEHLQPLEKFLRDQGARVVSSGRPWSANCHIWVYFDAILECERLIKGLNLASCTQVHDHRGTHDGSERGIICTMHNDGIMGPHPADASPAAKIITVA
jgi:hypothetical protein